MLQLYKDALDEQGVFEGELPEIVQALSNAIQNYKIPKRMKSLLSISELVLFCSQFHKHIKMPDGTIVPINSISVALSPSGSGKDSSVGMLRECFAGGYKQINDLRAENAKARAQRLAEEDGVEDSHLFENYKAYYNHPQSLFSAPDSTIEGLIADFNELQDEQLGSGVIYSGEFSDEMGKGIADLMQFLSEVYDKGNKEVKKIKGAHKLKPLNEFPVSALLMSSPAGIIFDPVISAQFIRAFATKLARRSFFMYAPEKIPKPIFKSIIEADKWMEKLSDNAREAKKDIAPYITELTASILASDEEYVELTPETLKLFNRYKAYNEELAETIPPRFQISKLVREHLQWKSLKLAGAIALSKGKFEIEPEDYIEAITFSESLNEDMKAFEIELGKEPYERFVDFMHVESFDGQFEISLHDLRKMSFIPTTGKPPERIKELINLASSYDTEGIYTPLDDGIKYEHQVKTDEIGLSYLEVSGTKDQRAKACAKGFEYQTLSFPDLVEVLSGDHAYSPFQFTDGVRGKDNINSGCKWIVLDIDKSHITASEAHFTLSHLNHHIALTSDPDNEFKFRVLIELDAVVDIPNQQWKPFIASIASSLALEADPVAKSQIFFSYSDRPIMSCLDGEPLTTKEHILAATDTQLATPIKSLSPKEKSAQLNDISGTFEYAFEATNGARSVTLMRAAYHARDLGMPNEDILDLMDEISDYWLDPLPQEELDRNIKSQIRRW